MRLLKRFINWMERVLAGLEREDPDAEFQVMIFNLVFLLIVVCALIAIYHWWFV